MTGVGLTLAASLCWAALDAQRKGLAADLGPLVLVAYLTFGQAIAFGAGWAALGSPWPTPDYWLPGLGVLVSNLIASLVFVAAVRASPLSLTIPMLSFTPVLATIFGALLLGEQPSAMQLGGIAAVVVGALILQAGAVRGGPIAWARSLVAEPGARWMLGVALLWSLSGVLDKLGLAQASVPVHGALQAVGITGLLLVWLGVRGRLAELGRVRGRGGRVALAMGTSVAAVGLQYLAILVWYVSLVEATKRAIGLIASVISGRLLFGEPVHLGKVAGITLMTAGVLALILG